MNRRDILKGILKAAITGVALSGATAAAAQTMGLNKYAKMVQLQVFTIKLHNEIRGDSLRPVRFHPRCGEIAASMEQVLSFSMEHFTGDATSPEAFEACREVFQNRDLDTMSEEGLKQIMEVVVPVAVARNLLAVHRISFDPKHVKSWDQFSDRYSKMILQA